MVLCIGSYVQHLRIILKLSFGMLEHVDDGHLFGHLFVCKLPVFDYPLLLSSVPSITSYDVYKDG